jgi:hypothetical protein
MGKLLPLECNPRIIFMIYSDTNRYLINDKLQAPAELGSSKF